MSLEQINEYLEGWNSTATEESSVAQNPSAREMEMFNFVHGIARKKIPKK